MWKRLGIVFAIQTAIFTIATGYDQFTQGGIQAFIRQQTYSTDVIVILFWIIPLVVTILLEGLFRFGKWCKDFIEQKYFSWQLSKRKFPKLSHSELLRIINAANHRGLLSSDEMEKFERLMKNVGSIDVLLLEFLDDPFAVFLHESIKDSSYQKGSYYSLFCFIFPFFRRREELIKSSVLKLYQLKLITINFDEFVMKIPENSQETYCTSPLGHKLIYLIKKAPSYS